MPTETLEVFDTSGMFIDGGGDDIEADHMMQNILDDVRLLLQNSSVSNNDAKGKRH